MALWPLFVWHAVEFYPAQAHVRLMIEGLMGSFIIGFLGTAGPRLLDASPLIVAETFALFGLQIVSAFLHLAQRQTAGDIVFLTLLLFFAGMMAKRAGARNDLPPPQFILVIFGLLNAIAGIFLITAAKSLTKESFANQLGSLMLNEGFVLFPILGVGAFFFPKLLGGAKPEPSDLRIATAIWIKRAADRGTHCSGNLELICVGSARVDACGGAGARPNDPDLFRHARSFARKTKRSAIPRTLFSAGRAAAGYRLTSSGDFSRLSCGKSAPDVHRWVQRHSFYRQHASDYWSRGAEPFISKTASLSGRGSHAANHRNDCQGRRRFHSARAQQSPCLRRADLASCRYCLVRGARAEIVSKRRVNRAFLARRFAGES